MASVCDPPPLKDGCRSRLQRRQRHPFATELFIARRTRVAIHCFEKEFSVYLISIGLPISLVYAHPYCILQGVSEPHGAGVAAAMRIVGMENCSENPHWGQCFEEFYGPEYCKNLKKDLEKLKDEFYDGNARRFQREWVVPTANLLRRMRHMGFPVRTQDFIVIHLYNPVDSMSPGEMHFQVGRKAPGTLTLKFTKQNPDRLFVIQPKTLSNTDEARLNEDPLIFLDQVRQDMREVAADAPNMLRTMVLMTETCKLQRQCAKDFFSNAAERVSMNKASAFQMGGAQFATTTGGSPTTTTATNTTNNNQWMAATLMNPELNSIRGDGSVIPFPLNFCVKNYVNCNTKPVSEIGLQHLAQVTSYNKTGNGRSLVHQQSRTTTWHSEPEENDETIGLQSFNESNWPRVPPTSIEEIQRRMSDTRLWEATKMPAAEPKPVPSGPGASSEQMRTSLTDEYTGDNVAVHTAERRNSEPRTAVTAEYFQQMSGEQYSWSESGNKRTALTEQYTVQDQSLVVEDRFRISHSSVQAPGSISPRTAVVDEYTGRCPVIANEMRSALHAFVPKTPAAGSPLRQGLDTLVDGGDGRRTSSLDAYIGNNAPLCVPLMEPRARSETDLTTTPVRTNLVDQYFHGEQPMRSGAPDFYQGPLSTQYGVGSRRFNSTDNDPNMQELNGVSLDSWTSHCGAMLSPVQRPDERTRGYPQSVGSDETGVSLLSHTSYPSWASHPHVPRNPSEAPLPLTIEQINRNMQNWKQWAPPNSLN